MEKKQELDRLLVGFIIAHPNEKMEEILKQIILNNKLEHYKKRNNFFKTDDITLTSKDIIKILYNHWKKSLEDSDYFTLSNTYAAFIEGNKINVIGHFRIEDINDFTSPLIGQTKDKQICFYQTVMPGTYEIDGIKVVINQKGKIKVYKDEVEYGIIDRKHYNTKEKIFYLTKKNKIDEDTINKLSEEYLKNLDINKVFMENGFTILDGVYPFLTNASSVKLQDNINGQLLQGNIEVATDRGYKSKPEMPQQDAVLSIVKSDGIFLNAIADGAGGSENGQKASREAITELKEWFSVIPNELFKHDEIIIGLLQQKICELDQRIYKKYKNSYTTIVIAITINDKTILANIGDSTAYTYDSNNNSLKLLTKTDSETSDLDYEDARLSLWNNVITAALGDGYKQDLHINVIENNGQKIILSSDGVTDLVSEERFKSYFTNEVNSSQIVNDALSDQDTKYSYKKEDNISVIIVKLPEKTKTKKLV